MLAIMLLSYVQTRWLYITLMLIVRSFQGLASGIIQTCAYAIVTIFFPKEQERVIGIIESVQGMLRILPKVQVLALAWVQ